MAISSSDTCVFRGLKTILIRSLMKAFAFWQMAALNTINLFGLPKVLGLLRG